MAHIIADRVVEISTTVGTSPYVLLGLVTGYRTASSVCVNGDTFEYYAEDIDANGALTGAWETGLGTWSTGNIIARTLVYASSNNGNPVAWVAGTRRIALAITAETFNAITSDFASMATSLINTQTLLVTFATA